MFKLVCKLIRLNINYMVIFLRSATILNFKMVLCGQHTLHASDKHLNACFYTYLYCTINV